MSQIYASVTAEDSGQSTTAEHNHDGEVVYITDDRKAIVVNEIHYDIYNPEASTNTEKWFTLMPFKMTEVDFSLSKAITGIKLESKDYTRNEIKTCTTQTTEFYGGKIKQDSVNYTLVSETPEFGSYASNAMAALNGMSLALNILKNFADAVNHTTLYFYFQKSESGNHRVIIMGGTYADYQKYINYEYYNMYRSYLDNIVPSNLKPITRDGMKETVRELIDVYLSLIDKGISRARLLVEQSELELRGDEYYDIQLYLVPTRMYKKHQVYLYEDGKLLHQKYITWPNESLVIVKRVGLFGKVTKLIELIDDTGTVEGNYKYWEIFEDVLRRSSGTDEDKVADPSDATYAGLANLEDKIPANAGPISAYNLENMNG